MTPLNNQDPWLSELWLKEFNCDPLRDDCLYGMTDIPDYSPYSKTALFSDTVKTFAYGIKAVVEKNCPEAVGHRYQLRKCLLGKDLLKAMRNVSFEGSYGLVRFDENGDADGKYQIEQLKRDEVKN